MVSLVSGPTAGQEDKKEIDRAVQKVVNSMYQASIGDGERKPFEFNGLKFEHAFSECENEWVLIKEPDSKTDLILGFVYIDPSAGFTFHGESIVFWNEAKQVEKRTTEAFQQSRLMLRLGRQNSAMAALLPDAYRKELGLPVAPDWLKFYEPKDMSEIEKQVTWGRFYNAIGNPKGALTFLQRAQDANPRQPGLAFEISYSFNALRQPQKAAEILIAAIETDPSNYLYYKELGFSRLYLGEYDKAAETLKEGIDVCPENRADMKAEMALHVSEAYRMSKEMWHYNKWVRNAREWAPEDSPLFK